MEIPARLPAGASPPPLRCRGHSTRTLTFRTKIFLSHSSKDKWAARQIVREIETLGISVFLDEKDIRTRKGSTIAPPFAQLLHTIHLVGSPNRFLTAYQGDCTHCHKLDQKTGAWKLPTGNEE